MTRGRRDADACVVGDVIDGWTVEAYEPDRLLAALAPDSKLPGRGWLEFEVTPLDAGRARGSGRPPRSIRAACWAGRIGTPVLPLHA